MAGGQQPLKDVQDNVLYKPWEAAPWGMLVTTFV